MTRSAVDVVGRRRSAMAAVVAAAAAWLALGVARAQPAPGALSGRSPFGPRPAPAASARAVEVPRALRARFGIDVVERLVRSGSVADKLRGVARAGALGTPEAIGLLARAVEPNGEARTDARVMLETARALAPWAADSTARSGLIAILDAAPAPSPRGGIETEGEGARLSLAREVAALALARAGAVDALAQRVRSGQAAQGAAVRALVALPPADLAELVRGAPNVAVLRLLADLGDLRGLDAVHEGLRARDPSARAAALDAAGALRDMRAIDVARAAGADADPRVRIAGAGALVALDAPDRGRAVEALLAADATALAGARLAEAVADVGVVRALAARAAASADEGLRVRCLAALGRQPSSEAAQALLAFVRDPALATEAAAALAGAPGPVALAALLELASAPVSADGRARGEGAGDAKAAVPGDALRRLAVRALAVRAMVRREGLRETVALGRILFGSRDATDRAVGAFARVALGDLAVERALADQDAGVRRAAVLAAHGRPGATTCEALRARISVEREPAARQLLAAVLAEGDRAAAVSTNELVARVEAGAADGPLAVLALVARGDEAQSPKGTALLASRDPVARAHAARGLAWVEGTGATGKLAAAYRAETDVTARRAVVLALVRREARADAGAPERTGTLALAAAFDPDATIRAAARGSAAALDAIAGAGPCSEPSAAPREVAWLHVAIPDAEPGALPACNGVDAPAPPGRRATAHRPCAPIVGTVVRPDGLALPIAFDDDGVALLPGVPPGEARLVLAPRLSTAGSEPE